MAETSNKIFLNLKRKGSISEKETKCFVYDFNNAINLVKLCFLPKIHKKLFNVPGRPVIFNCGTPTEKSSEFLDYHLKPVMQRSWSYIEDSGDFIEKIKRKSNIPDDAILVTEDVVGIYQSKSHEPGLKALEKALEKRDSMQISTSDLVKMTNFVLQNNYLNLMQKPNKKFLVLL